MKICLNLNNLLTIINIRVSVSVCNSFRFIMKMSDLHLIRLYIRIQFHPHLQLLQYMNMDILHVTDVECIHVLHLHYCSFSSVLTPVVHETKYQ